MTDSTTNSRRKLAISVSEMARTLHLSRARFYELIDAGVMPPPCYLVRTRRPFYPYEVQEVCRRVKDQGLGINNEPVVFYTARGSSVDKRMSRPKKKNKTNTKPNPTIDTLLIGLKQLGVNGPDRDQLNEILAELYPSGVSIENEGELLATVFRRLKRRN